MPDPVAQVLHAGPDAHHERYCARKVLGAEKDVIVYGAGSGYVTLSEFVLRKHGYRPHLILDRKFSCGTTFDGHRADNPDNLSLHDFANENAVFVVSIGDEAIYRGVRAMLVAKGASKVIWALDLYQYHLSHAALDFTPDEFLRDKEKIDACFRLLEDDASREVFLKILETHVRKVPVAIPSFPLKDQYFPHDIVLSKGYSRLINCGSYNGDTVRQLHARFGKVEALACFEPDPENFSALSRYLRRQAAEIADAVVSFPCGLHSDEVKLRFSSGNNTNSSFSESGETHVQCVSIDHVLPHFRPTLINMDIEGAEPEALRGAASTIAAFLPDLAISVYHMPSHIYDLPLLVKEICPDYRIYLRNYTSYPAETVMYATV